MNNYIDTYCKGLYRVFLPDDNFILNLPDEHKYIINKIYLSRVFDRTIKEYVPLYSLALKSILGRYNCIIKDLVNWGIVIVNNSYYADNGNGKCKGYKLSDKYKGVKVKKNYIQNPKIIKRIDEYKNPNIPKIKHHRFLYDNLQKLDIDYNNALKELQGIKDEDTYNYIFISLEHIQNKQIPRKFTVDSVAGRVHHNITNLKGEFRKYLSFKNQKLVNIDIANSQPFLFNILLNKSEKEAILLINNYFREAIKRGREKKYKSLPYVSPISKLDCKNNELKDVNFYHELTSKGILYDYLMDKWNIKIDRGDFKKIFFGQVFYINPHINNLYEYRRLFDKEFPNVSRKIDYYKNGSKRALPIILQRAESNLMIEKIIKRIYEERKNIFVLTIHDSILTTEENTEYVKNVILDEFLKNHNLIPKLKIEKYGNE